MIPSLGGAIFVVGGGIVMLLVLVGVALVLTGNRRPGSVALVCAAASFLIFALFVGLEAAFGVGRMVSLYGAFVGCCVIGCLLAVVLNRGK